MKLQRVLEEKPKERLLHQVLTEIENRWSSKQRKTQEGKEDGSPPFTPSASANVLLMVKDERALQSIRSFLSDGGGKHAVTKSYLHYLDSVVEKVKPVLRPGPMLHDYRCFVLSCLTLRIFNNPGATDDTSGGT